MASSTPVRAIRGLRCLITNSLDTGPLKNVFGELMASESGEDSWPLHKGKFAMRSSLL